MQYPPALVVSRNWSPVSIFPKLSITNGKDAIQKYMEGKCEVLEFYDRPVLSKGEPIEYGPKGILFWPSVIVDPQKKIKNSIRLSLSVLYFREHGRCYWCNEPTHQSKGTKDHVMPQCQGGEDTFENVVFSCFECNNVKGDSLPVGKWKPHRPIRKPTYSEMLEMRKKHEINVYDETWLKFLPGFVNYRVYGENGAEWGDV